jgi:hypothetical protein
VLADEAIELIDSLEAYLALLTRLAFILKNETIRFQIPQIFIPHTQCTGNPMLDGLRA